MMLSWTNKQQGLQKYSKLYSHNQDIYDWISLFNKLLGLWFILTQKSMGEMNEYGKSSHLSIFTSLKQLMMRLKWKMFRASCLHHIKDTDSM